MMRVPTVTLMLCIITIALSFLSNMAQEALYFDLHALDSGRWIGLLSGHWMHADAEHLLWNVSALGVLAGVIEVHSRRLLLVSLLAGMASVNLLLLSPLTDITRYCGLSGILNTLLGVMLYIAWQKTQSGFVIAVGVLSLLKIVLEIMLAESLFTSASWPPFAMAHLAGLAATPVALYLFSVKRCEQLSVGSTMSKGKQSCSKFMLQ
ncbi:MAG: rhomboid family intramembrane serine protease [Halioglobus sp.]